MMNIKIPIVVFCLVAVSVSLAQPLVEQDVSKGWDSKTAWGFKIKGRESSHYPERASCYYGIVNCIKENNAYTYRCELRQTKGASRDCPPPKSNFFDLNRSGKCEVSYSELKLENPTHPIPESATVKFEIINSKISIVRFPSFAYSIVITQR
eukprot:Nk52_evm52s158 gene=Nk52_evmTU52s158